MDRFGRQMHHHGSVQLGHGRKPTRDTSRSETRQNNNKNVSVLPALSRMRAGAKGTGGAKLPGSRRHKRYMTGGSKLPRN